ncbi:MAG: hypothetical protein JNK79_08355 [Chitinophagaceae bacterium]|nr:hypothetical protein [Chitinophagaceae bacterium]
MARVIISILMLFCFSPSHPQQMKGSWYGRADVITSGPASNYLTELVLKQKGNDLEGIFGYYFKDSYQSFFVRGTFNPKTRLVNIRNIPLLFYGSSSRTGIECPMHFEGKLMVSKVNSTLSGTFYTEAKYRYTCPELRVSMKLDASENYDSTLTHVVAGRKFWSPQAEDVVITGNPAMPVIQVAAPVQQENPEQKLVDEFAKRNTIYEKDITVYDDSILVSFYDNGDIDDDTISVFLNKKPILIKRGLSARALNIYIGLDSATEVNELSMFADNLGKFPPNTALMVISDRQKRYELYLSASLKQNASVRLRRPRKM